MEPRGRRGMARPGATAAIGTGSGSLESASTFLFAVPGRYQMSKSNIASSDAQRCSVAPNLAVCK